MVSIVENFGMVESFAILALITIIIVIRIFWTAAQYVRANNYIFKLQFDNPDDWWALQDKYLNVEDHIRSDVVNFRKWTFNQFFPGLKNYK